MFVKFFKFYSDSLANAREKVYAIHTMKTIKRYELHPELSRTEFIIQDPIKLSHNVSQNVNQSGLGNIHQQFQSMHQHLAGLNVEISLIDIILRSPILKKKTLKKQLQHQNQSKNKSPEMYIIPLPKSESDPDDAESCANRIRKFLIEKLQMHLKSDDDATVGLIFPKMNIRAPTSDLNAIASAETITTSTVLPTTTGISTSTTSTVMEQQSEGCYNDVQSKKRKAETLDTEENEPPLKKKGKMMTSSSAADNNDRDDKVTFSCIAYHESWLSRRKMRRQTMHKQDTKQQKTDESLTATNGIMKEQTVINTDGIERVNVANSNTFLEEVNNANESSSSVSDTANKNLEEVDNVIFNSHEVRSVSSTEKTDVKLEIEFTVSLNYAEKKSPEENLGEERSQLCMKLVKGDLKSYQTFFAFFKKEIVNLLSSNINKK